MRTQKLSVFKSYIILIFVVVQIALTSSDGYAGAWTLKKGQLWVKSSVFFQHTSERYATNFELCDGSACKNGERTPFFFNGKVKSNVAIFDAWYGVSDKLELQFQLPFFDIAFTDDIDPNRASSNEFGDVKFGMRYNILSRPLVATLNVAAKAPTGFFNKDAETVPVGDGQWDLHVQGQFARSLWPLPVYLNLDVGYRYRFDPDVSKTNLTPGDEITLRGEVGVNLRKQLLLKAAIDGLWGKEFTAIFVDSELLLNNSERRILYFEPGLYWQALPQLALEASVGISLAGKNYPAGQVYGLGLSYTFSF